MRIVKGDKTIDIPNWALLVGALVIDNIIANVCRTKALKATVQKDKKG